MDNFTIINHVGDFMRSEELNELYWLNIEIKDLENRLKELEESAGVSSAKLGDGIHGSDISNPVEKVAIKKMQLKKRLAEVMLLVKTIPDSQLRTIVRLRNIDLMTWQEIGDVLGLDRKTVSTKYNNFIKKLKKRIEENEKTKM